MANTAIIPSNTDKRIALDLFLLENSMTVSGWSASITILILSPFQQELLRETFSSYSLPLYEYLQSNVQFIFDLQSTARISSISASTEISLIPELCTNDQAVNSVYSRLHLFIAVGTHTIWIIIGQESSAGRTLSSLKFLFL